MEEVPYWLLMAPVAFVITGFTTATTKLILWQQNQRLKPTKRKGAAASRC